MPPTHTVLPAANRRVFLRQSGLGLGGAALAGLLARSGSGQTAPGLLAGPHHPPRARRMISLVMAGGPASQDLFDYKPLLNERHGSELPDSVRGGQRLTGMSSQQSSLPLAGSAFQFARHGKSGAWVSELLPHTAKVADELCFVKSCHTEAINHDPTMTLLNTGHTLAGRPALGSWLSYGLGSEADDLPAFVVLVSKDRVEQGLYARLWGSAFLPARHQGVQFRSGSDAVLYLSNPAGVSGDSRRQMLDRLAELERAAPAPDPALAERISQYELAYRMQSGVPGVLDFSNEPASTWELYGDDARKPGTFAANCLLARRLVEKGVRFVQLYHPGWDQHANLPAGIKRQCADTDRASAALVTDLKRRGLLGDTLVAWGGEFGRTCYSQGAITKANYGRDHHPRSFTTWLAGGGVKPGVSYGATDEFGYNVAENPVAVHDLQATILHLLGIDHTRLTHQFQGRYYRLTDVHGEVVKGIVAG